MKLVKQALAVLGTVVVIAVIAALVTPKTAHAIIATAVNVVNPPSQPVPTVATDAVSSFVAQGDCFFANDQFGGAGSCFLSNIYTVPQGKIAVIESINASCTVSSGTSLWRLAVSATDPSNSGIIYELEIPPAPPVSTNLPFLDSQTAVSLKSYAGAGAISMDVFASGAATGNNCVYILIGHLVSAQ